MEDDDYKKKINFYTNNIDYNFLNKNFDLANSSNINYFKQTKNELVKSSNSRILEEVKNKLRKRFTSDNIR